MMRMDHLNTYEGSKPSLSYSGRNGDGGGSGDPGTDHVTPLCAIVSKLVLCENCEFKEVEKIILLGNVKRGVHVTRGVYVTQNSVRRREAWNVLPSSWEPGEQTNSFAPFPPHQYKLSFQHCRSGHHPVRLDLGALYPLGQDSRAGAQTETLGGHGDDKFRNGEICLLI
jgi:hypothetical protein